MFIPHSVKSVLSKRSEGMRKQRMKKKLEQVRRRKKGFKISDSILEASSSKIMEMYTTTRSDIPFASKVNTPESLGTLRIARKCELGMVSLPLNKKNQTRLHSQTVEVAGK